MKRMKRKQLKIQYQDNLLQAERASWNAKFRAKTWSEITSEYENKHKRSQSEKRRVVQENEVLEHNGKEIELEFAPKRKRVFDAAPIFIDFSKTKQTQPNIQFDDLFKSAKSTKEPSTYEIVGVESILDRTTFNPTGKAKQAPTIDYKARAASARAALPTSHAFADLMEAEKAKEASRTSKLNINLRNRMNAANKQLPIATEFERMMEDEEKNKRKSKWLEAPSALHISTPVNSVWGSPELAEKLKPISTKERIPGGKTWGKTQNTDSSTTFSPHKRKTWDAPSVQELYNNSSDTSARKPNPWSTITYHDRKDDDFYGQPRSNFIDDLIAEEQEKDRQKKKNRSKGGRYGMGTSNFDDIFAEEMIKAQQEEKNNERQIIDEFDFNPSSNNKN